MIIAILQLIRDLFVRPKFAWGFIKTAFGYFYLKEQRRMTMGEIKVVNQRIRTLKESGNREYERLFLEMWKEEYGFMESKAKMTGKRNHKLRMKTKYRDGKGKIEKRLRTRV